jgi:NAD(P)-dependent dehydrogenase (short-subunit alcohol dehydrogenase family)
MSERLKDKVAIITGGNSGIGESTGRVFAKEGAKVILMARREEQGRQVAESIRNEGGEAHFISCDISDNDAVLKAVAEAAGIHGRIDILFNNAGGGSRQHFPEEPVEEFMRVVGINLFGTFFVSQAVWPHLVKSGGGAVVNMSSLAAQRGFSPRMFNEFGAPGASYIASKSGIEGLTRYMAGRGGEHNIRVNCVRPGQIMTPGASRGTLNDPDGGHHVSEKMFAWAQILKGRGYPEDVANLVLFLSCEESRFVTGQIINVDGGVAAKI